MIQVGFEVLTAVVMKSSVFCAITPCSPFKGNRCFRGTCRPHLQGQRISQVRNQHEADSKPFQQTARCYVPEDTTPQYDTDLLLSTCLWFVHFHTEVYAVGIILYSPYICAISLYVCCLFFS
jgi:hypothetical protein